MRDRDDDRHPRLVAFGVLVLLVATLFTGCAIGLNQGAEQKVEQFRQDIVVLNERLDAVQKELRNYYGPLEQLVILLRKFWNELHPEDSK